MEIRSTRAAQLTEPIVEQTDNSVNSAVLSTLSASIMEHNEVVRYVLMSPEKIRTIAAESTVLADSYIKEIRSAWKTGDYSKAGRLEIINDSMSPCVRMQMRLRAQTNDHDELLQDILKFCGEQKTLPQQDIASLWKISSKMQQMLYERQLTLWTQERYAAFACPSRLWSNIITFSNSVVSVVKYVVGDCKKQ